ncbi:MAG: DNA topoisomerase VI subunit B [Thermoproteota archaeon]|nr:MAG: DNA topoisomerase VI subunit B [Candidatus Korarchaeota archaeon]
MPRREEYVEISPSDFFYRNKDIAGFDNPVRATYMIVRELVENALDACDRAGRAGNIYVAFRGKGSGVFQVEVLDDGIGVPEDEIPKAFGKVLYSSKYVLRQSRGTFGLGGTMALLYGQITTHEPFEVCSSIGDGYAARYRLRIDIQNNKPIVERKQRIKVPPGATFTLVKLTFEGNYERAKGKILEYLKQTAIITPYINIVFRDPKGAIYVFPRATTKLPEEPKESKYHPYGVDVEVLKRLISETKTRNLVSFLSKSFQSMGRQTAIKVLKKARLDPEKNPRKLTDRELVKLVRALRSYDKFRAPDASCLSPVGEEALEKGIVKELRPEFVKVVQRPPSAYEGHPFIVEVGVAYGGGVPATGDIVLYRFANRIPLLYDAASDVAYKVIRKIDWSTYYVDPARTPMAVFVHICSTKIPFKTVGKEFIADKPEIAREIELGIRECARALRSYILKKIAKQRIVERYKIMRKYYEIISESLSEILGRRIDPTPVLKRIAKPAGEEVSENGEADNRENL